MVSKIKLATFDLLYEFPNRNHIESCPPLRRFLICMDLVHLNIHLYTQSIIREDTFVWLVSGLVGKVVLLRLVFFIQVSHYLWFLLLESKSTSSSLLLDDLHPLEINCTCYIRRI